MPVSPRATVGASVGDAAGVGVGDPEPTGVGDVDGATVGVDVGVPEWGTVFPVPPDPLHPAIAMKDANSAPAATVARAFRMRWKTNKDVSLKDGVPHHPNPEVRAALMGGYDCSSKSPPEVRRKSRPARPQRVERRAIPHIYGASRGSRGTTTAKKTMSAGDGALREQFDPAERRTRTHFPVHVSGARTRTSP